MTGLQFVHLGADVVKVEPPGGAPSRHIGPFVDDEPDPDRSLAYWYYNGGKRSVVVDLERRRWPGRSRSTARRPPMCSSSPCIPGELRRLGLDLADDRRRPPESHRRVDHRLRPHRAVGRLPVERPRRARHERAADHLGLRRPLDPADPPRRRPGVPHRGQLRPHRGAARPAAAPADRRAVGSSTCRCRRPPP